MKKIILVILIMLVLGIGCAEDGKVKQPKRFQSKRGFDNVRVITDTKTGVQYLFIKYGNGAGLCKLETGRDVR